jgi:hypothetical protein
MGCRQNCHGSIDKTRKKRRRIRFLGGNGNGLSANSGRRTFTQLNFAHQIGERNFGKSRARASPSKADQFKVR